MTIPWLPDWYVPGWPVAEDAVKALFISTLPADVPGAVDVVNQLPDNDLGTGWTGRLLYVARAGGAITTARHDQAAMQLAAITNTRADSLTLQGFVRDVLTCIGDNEVDVELSDGSIVTITDVVEIAGPEEVPGVEYDELIVPGTYLFTFTSPLETPDYSRYIGG